MKYFASALLATATYARGNSGGILQGAVNSSVGGQHGYGYNVGNTYEHGDSHGQHMGHQYGYDNNNSPLPGAAYQNENVNLHIFGYDAVLPDPDFDLAIAEAIRDAVITELGNANLARETYILDVLQRRRERLSDIHEDNLLKIEAPFDYQLDMLEEEVSDIEDAMSAAGDDADDAWADLQERMNKYLEDRQEALNREMDKVLRILNRAVDEGKDIADVLAAMRLDWLQGVYVAGQEAYFNEDLYDLTVFDNEFDLFTYDIGHGKGHGHRNTVQGPGNNRENGFVVGRGGVGEINELNGRPVPEDGVRGRYDRATQSGEGRRPSDYQIGSRQTRAAGARGYDQAADLRVDSDLRRGMAPKRPAKRPAKRPSKRPAQRPAKRPSYGRKPRRSSYRSQPKQSYQRTRQISKRTSYDDYAPIRRGGYYGY